MIIKNRLLRHAENVKELKERSKRFQVLRIVFNLTPLKERIVLYFNAVCKSSIDYHFYQRSQESAAFSFISFILYPRFFSQDRFQDEGLRELSCIQFVLLYGEYWLPCVGE